MKWGIEMALNKTILKKVGEMTKDDKEQREFIIKILDEENKGLGQYTKLYEKLIKEAIKKGE